MQTDLLSSRYTYGEPTAMFDYKNFDHVFGRVAPFPDRAYHQETETFRRSFDGVLFIDRVLKALGITKGEWLPWPNR